MKDKPLNKNKKSDTGDVVTENELFARYLRNGWDDVMDFHDYLERCKDLGMKIIRSDD